MFILLSLLACLVTPHTSGGDDTNKHSSSLSDDTAAAEAG